MAFPTIPTVAASRILTANQADTTATRTFPSLTGLTKNSGDLLIAIVVGYQTSGSPAFSSWGGGFTEFLNVSAGSNMCVGAAYKWSTGSETGTFSVTQAATITGHASLMLLSIAGAHPSSPPEVTGLATGTSAAANPAALTPSWGAADNLWISLVGDGMTSGTGSWTGTGSTPPTSYGSWADSNTTDNSVVGQTEVGVSFRQLNAASEDVGTAGGVDVSNARNVAVAIAVRPDPNQTVSVSGLASEAAFGTVTASTPFALHINNAESQTSGTTVTTGNSGGTDATAFDSVAIGANMTLTFDNANPAHGSNSFKYALTSTATAITTVGWNLGSTLTEAWGAFYMKSNLGSPPASLRLIQFRKAGAMVSGIKWRSGAGTFGFADSAWTDIGTGSTGGMPANTLYRYEWHVLFNTSTGTTATLNMYSGDGTSLLDSATVSGISMGAGVDEIRFGANTANFSTTSGDWFILDDLNVNNTGYPGPGPYSASGGQTRTMTGLASEASFGTVTVVPGGTTQAVSGLASEASFGAVTIQTAITQGVSGLASEAAFGSVTAVPGGFTQAVSGLASEQAFGTVTVVPGGTTQAVSGLASEQAFGTVTASAGGSNQTQLVSGLASEAAFGSPTAQPGAVLVSMSGLASEAAYGTVTALPGAVSVTPAGLASEAAFGAIAFTTGNVNVSMAGLSSEGQIGGPSVASNVTVPVTGLASAAAQGAVTIGVGNVIVPITGLPSAQSFSTPGTSGGDAPTFNPSVHGGASRRR